MSKDDKTDLPDLAELEVSTEFSTPPALELDTSKYLPDVEDFDMTEAQKIELLETLWEIMRAFVELGFDVNICEQLFRDSDGLPDQKPDDVP